MTQGRITLRNGLTVNCAYELHPDGGGQLSLFAALWTILKEGDTATLTLNDNSRRDIRIVRRVDQADAHFRSVEPR
jgi:hypothetical protein